MPLRSIGSQTAQMSDECLSEIQDLVGARMAASLANDGHKPLDLRLLMDAARTATEIKDPSKHQAVMRYISSLHEPQRTIFLRRKDGWTAKEIAAGVGLDLKPVCEVLAKMYADLNAILNGCS